MVNLKTFCQYFFTYGGYKDYLKGLSNTAIIAVFGLLIGFLIGCLIAVVKIIPNKKSVPLRILEKICDGYVALFRGTPMVVQLLLMHFALFPALGLDINSVAEAVIIFGLNSGAYMAEILRGGINAVDGGQMEAGRSLGFGFAETMFRIILPQAIKNILPTLGNEFIVLIKETSIVSFIAVTDLYKSFKQLGDPTYDYTMPYLMLALTYLVMVLLISWGVRALERKMKKSER